MLLNEFLLYRRDKVQNEPKMKERMLSMHDFLYLVAFLPKEFINRHTFAR